MKQKSHIRPIVIVMIFAFLTIGYAYLTSSLNINGSTLLKKPTWDVHFENIQVKDGSVTGEQVIQEPEIDSEQTTVTFHVNLKLPGDFYEFTVDAVNAGTIDAMIDNYSDLELTEDQQKYLETSITYEDGEEVLEHQQLLAGDTAIYKVRVGYKLDLEAEDLPSNPEELDLEFSVEFVQRDEDVAIERRTERALYNVLKKEAESGGLALRYTGEHQDSMDASLSTKDIYHWYADNDTDGKAIRDKYNVIFANNCWQMIRTTDTGGVKLLYNGVTYNDQCFDSRNGNNNVGYSGYSIMNMTSEYYYGSDYVFDSNTKKFAISGDIVHQTWSGPVNTPEILGKYTCKSNNVDDVCSTLYYVLPSTVSDVNVAYYSITSSNKYASYGVLPYNHNGSSLSEAGYVEGDTSFSYIMTYNVLTAPLKFNSIKKTLFNSRTLNNTAMFSKNISFDGTNYSLVDPVLGSTIENEDYTGYYTIGNSNTTGTGVYYLIGNSGTSYYYVYLNSTKTSKEAFNIYIADSYTDNNDNSYSLTNYTTVSVDDWFINYSNYSGKFLCENGSTCSTLYYVTGTSNSYFNYYSTFIVIGKSRSGLNLLDTIKVHYGDIAKNPSNYSAYKYSCFNTSTTCTDSNLKYIQSFSSTSIKYNSNYRFASSVTWDGSKYILNSPLEIESVNVLSDLNTHHYYCGSVGVTECTNVYFLIYTGTAWTDTEGIVYMIYKNGNTSLDDMIPSMFENNIKDSMIKMGTDAWFKKYMLDYLPYLEDTIFCNDRTILNPGGYSPTGSIKSNLTFNGVSSSNYKSLYCNRIYDRFSTSNPLAKLDYPVALISSPEIKLINNTKATTNPSTYYWTMTPSSFVGLSNQHTYVSVNRITNYGSVSGERVDYVITNELRPSISLKPGITYSSGDGSRSNPYIIDTN